MKYDGRACGDTYRFIVEKDKFEIGNSKDFKKFISKKVGYKFKSSKK